MSGGDTDEPRRRRRLAAVLAAIAGLAALVAVGVVVLIKSSDAPKPGAFYTPPSPLPAQAPGTVLRSEPIGDPPAGSRGWKILYISTSFTGRPTAVSGMVFVAKTKAPAGGRNVIVSTPGTVGIASKCAVSTVGSKYWTTEIPGLTAFLQAGDVVVVPDYQGLGTPGPHPYLVGDSEAAASLDAVRAAHHFGPANASTRFVVSGTSQGGHAALFAGQRAGSYAPELKLEGVAASAPATDLKALYEANADSLSGRILSAYTLDAWSNVYPQLRINDVLTRVARPVVRRLASQCLFTKTALIPLGAGSLALKISYLRKLPWETEPWKGLLARNSPGAVKIPAPVVITQGTVDEVVSAAVTKSFVRRLCKQGSAVRFRTYPGVGHLDVGRKTEAEIQSWIAARFAGEPAPSTCA